VKVITRLVLVSVMHSQAAPGLRLLLDSIVQSLPGLAGAMTLLVFTVAVFAIIGVEQFGGLYSFHSCCLTSDLRPGTYRRACVVDPPPGLSHSEYDEYIHDSANWAYDVWGLSRLSPLCMFIVAGVSIICGNSSSAASCPVNATCLPDVAPNPNFGYNSFDNFYLALISVYQACFFSSFLFCDDHSGRCH
jgi:hypothetical protein